MKSNCVTATILALASLAIGLTTTTGCAHARVKSGTEHAMTHRTVALPPGWTVAGVKVANGSTANAFEPLALTAPGAATTSFWASLVAPRPRVFTDYQETWTDSSSGGGTFVFTDPAASQLEFDHTNQSALGGGRVTKAGSIASTITTNAVNAITAGGSAVGNVIGAAASAAAGK